MTLRAYFILLCGLPILASCNQGETPEQPTIDSNPELVAACRHIEGGGASVTGGDGGTIYRVSRLDDAKDPNTGGPMAGTLRYAINQSGARRVIFTTSGTIHLNSELRIRTGNITIDGQTAPGDGICIADYPLIINASNVIVRFIRVRLGDVSNTESDAVSVNNATGVVLDHLSCSWSVDECVSCYGNTNFTMQYCIVSESLRNSIHDKGSHGYGGIWGGTNASFHHNLLAHHDSRNPRFDHSYVNNTCYGPIDYVNNVVFNWGGNSTYGGEGYDQARKINMVNNYYKYGPITGKKTRLVDPTVSCEFCSDGHTLIPGKFFLSGNYMFGSPEVTADNWKGSTQQGANVKATTRWTSGLTALKNEQTAEAAYETVLDKAGCSLVRDAVDLRIVNDVRNGVVRDGVTVTSSTVTGSNKKNPSKGGLIDTQSDVGGWPELQTADKPQDTDYDGIPDEWERQFGLNPSDPLDARTITLVSGYTNLEVYLRHLVRNLY